MPGENHPNLLPELPLKRHTVIALRVELQV